MHFNFCLMYFMVRLNFDRLAKILKIEDTGSRMLGLLAILLIPKTIFFPQLIFKKEC